MNKAKVSRIMIWPSRKFSISPYNTAELNAGIEFVFDKPVDSDSKEVEDAYEQAGKIIRKEFERQYEPYKKLLKKGGEKNGQ
jgi:hypothetical protein